MATSRFEHFLRWRCTLDDPALEVDFSLAGLEEQHLAANAAPLDGALQAMAGLEHGAIANQDERRMVGHYWLRAPALAPTAEISETIRHTLDALLAFAGKVHRGELAPPEGGLFRRVLLIGIGGSALGPMLAAEALYPTASAMEVHVLDNTDPEGIDRMVMDLGGLRDVLVLVVSKSGGTPETRNGMLEIEAACRSQGLDFARRAVAITQEGSALDRRAVERRWLARFPMWDWVGGRTSELSAVGLLPAALQGADVRALLAGASAMDELTRARDVRVNPAALLALHWLIEGAGRGERAMVVLPYKDRLQLLSRYLQQLVMESLGKRQDRKGEVVHQGLAVYGNKGSTDQHAYVQQLRDGRHDFFALLVRVLHDRAGPSLEIDDRATSGDYLDGFLLGTRHALFEAGRRSVTITLERLDERGLGALIALFERTVGIYAELIDVNAYHQPGVEAGKKAAAAVLDVQRQLLGVLEPVPRGCAELAARASVDAADAWPVLRHLAANRPEVAQSGGQDPRAARFSRR